VHPHSRWERSDPGRVVDGRALLAERERRPVPAGRHWPLVHPDTVASPTAD
jgi:hypothetical protein